MGKTYSTEYGIGLRDEASQTIGNIQGKIRELNKALKDVAIGSQTFNDLKQELVATEGALSKAKEGIGRYGQEQNKLKNFIREERMEQRQQTFMFNQLKDVAGTAAIGLSLLGNVGGESMKKLSGALNQGFIAFQGLDFLLKGVAGPWGIAISVIGGVASALLSFSQETSKAKDELAKLDVQLINILFRMGEVSKEAKITVLEQQIASAQLRLLDLNKASIDWVATMKAAALGQIGAVWKGVGTPAEVKQAEIALATAREELQKFFKELEKGTKPAASKSIAEAFNFKPVAAGIVTSTKHLDEFNKKIKLTAQTVKIEIPAAWKEVQDETDKIYNHMKDISVQTLTIITSAMQVGFEAAFSGAAGAGRTFLKSLANGFITMVEGILIAAEANSMAKAVVSWGTTLIADLPMLALGFAGLEAARAVIGSLHEGGNIFYDAPPSQEALVRVRGQETINVQTPEQRGSSGGITIVNNFYGPISDDEWVKKLVESGLRKAGINDASDYFRNNRGSLVLS